MMMDKTPAGAWSSARAHNGDKLERFRGHVTEGAPLIWLRCCSPGIDRWKVRAWVRLWRCCVDSSRFVWPWGFFFVPHIKTAGMCSRCHPELFLHSFGHFSPLWLWPAAELWLHPLHSIYLCIWCVWIFSPIGFKGVERLKTGRLPRDWLLVVCYLTAAYF